MTYSNIQKVVIHWELYSRGERKGWFLPLRVCLDPIVRNGIPPEFVESRSLHLLNKTPNEFGPHILTSRNSIA